ncbi:MAG: hypothetical protein V3V05_11385 [Pontiella sp.]
MAIRGAQEFGVANGEQAVQFASDLCLQDEDNPVYRNTLAAACARRGNFTRAVYEQKIAIDLFSVKRRNSEEGKAYLERLELYEKGFSYATYCGLIGGIGVRPQHKK